MANVIHVSNVPVLGRQVMPGEDVTTDTPGIVVLAKDPDSEAIVPTVDFQGLEVSSLEMGGTLEQILTVTREARETSIELADRQRIRVERTVTQKEKDRVVTQSGDWKVDSVITDIEKTVNTQMTVKDRELFKAILTELKKANVHLSLTTDTIVGDRDVGG